MKTTFNYNANNKTSLNDFKTTSDFIDKFASGMTSTSTLKPKKTIITSTIYKIKPEVKKPKADKSWLMDYFDTYNVSTGEFKPAGYSNHEYIAPKTYYTIVDFSKFVKDFDDYTFYDQDGNKIEYFDNFIRISNDYDIKVIPTKNIKSYFIPKIATTPTTKKITINISFS